MIIPKLGSKGTCRHHKPTSQRSLATVESDTLIQTHTYIYTYDLYYITRLHTRRKDQCASYIINKWTRYRVCNCSACSPHCQPCFDSRHSFPTRPVCSPCDKSAFVIRAQSKPRPFFLLPSLLLFPFRDHAPPVCISESPKSLPGCRLCIVFLITKPIEPSVLPCSDKGKQ